MCTEHTIKQRIRQLWSQRTNRLAPNVRFRGRREVAPDQKARRLNITKGLKLRTFTRLRLQDEGKIRSAQRRPGVAYSSVLQPIVNYRPTYRFWGFDGPRSFSSDLYIVYFLHPLGVPFDVITEHDLALEAESVSPPEPENWATTISNL
jgi:hypothetical protein